MCYLIGMVIGAVYAIINYWDDIGDWWNDHVSPIITKNFFKKDDLQEEEA